MKKYRVMLCLFGILTFYHCKETKKNEYLQLNTNKSQIDNKNTIFLDSLQATKAKIHQKLTKQGLIRVSDLDSTISVELQYSTSHNFLKKDVYGAFDDAYLQAPIAKKLIEAQKILKQTNPDFSLLIYDAFRPHKVQYLMWEIVKKNHQTHYVASPKNGSVHNFGCAVDVTIYDNKTQKPLDMGTPFDFFGKEAEPKHQNYFLKKGILTPTHIKNRKLLNQAMIKAKFKGIDNEWWHFEGLPKHIAKQKYGFVDF